MSFPSAPPGAGAPPLIAHSAAGASDDLQALLREGVPDIDATFEFGPALSWASRKGHTHACNLLLEHRANPNKLNNAGMGPLSYAVLGEGHSHTDIVASLLRKGARDVAGDDGMTCLMVAALMGETAVCRMLWEDGAADLSALTDSPTTGKSVTALDMAMSNGHAETAALLRRAAAEHAAALRPRQSVRLVGLQSRPELNGRTAAVLERPSGGRVAVRVGEESLRVKPSSLRPATAPSAAPAPAATAAPAAAPAAAQTESPNTAVQVCWLKPASSGETYLPSLISKVDKCAVFKPAEGAKLHEYLRAQGMQPRKCLLPQLAGEPLVLWLKVQEGTPNGLATALASFWTASGLKAVCGRALLVRSTRDDGLPTADVFAREVQDAELLRMAMFINDATLPHSNINLRDEAVRSQLTTLWPAYDREHSGADTLVGVGRAVKVQKWVGGDSTATISTAGVGDYLADPAAWVASRRPDDADEREQNPFGLSEEEDAAIRASMAAMGGDA
tara:strand:+ start:101 stop:1612 length:1512 start_codon:yes stop_codon:yes gene_type:complete